MDVLAMMKQAARRLGSHSKQSGDGEDQLSGYLEQEACAAVADVINGLCVAVGALQKNGPDHPLLPNMRAALIRAGATPPDETRTAQGPFEADVETLATNLYEREQGALKWHYLKPNSNHLHAGVVAEYMARAREMLETEDGDLWQVVTQLRDSAKWNGYSFDEKNVYRECADLLQETITRRATTPNPASAHSPTINEP